MNQMMVRCFRSEQSLFDNPRCSRSGSVLKLASTYYTTYQMYCLSLRHSECIMFTHALFIISEPVTAAPAAKRGRGRKAVKKIEDTDEPDDGVMFNCMLAVQHYTHCIH